MTTPKDVIIIDDANAVPSEYKAALEAAGYAVRHISSMKGAVDYIGSLKAPASLYLIDLVMPVGDSGISLAESSNGLKAGVVIIQRLRAKVSDAACIMMMTFVPEEQIVSDIAQEIDVPIFQKVDVNPAKLVEIVGRKIGPAC